jgi:hypothetical protein
VQRDLEAANALALEALRRGEEYFAESSYWQMHGACRVFALCSRATDAREAEMGVTLTPSQAVPSRWGATSRLPHDSSAHLMWHHALLLEA